MRSETHWVIVLCAGVALLMASAYGTPLLQLADSGAPTGQRAYLLSKLLGLFALTLLVVQWLCVALKERATALLISHVVLGRWLLLVALAHVAFFVIASSLRGGTFAWRTLVPQFGASYYESMVGVGVLALTASLALGLSGALARRGKKGASGAHRVLVVMAVPIVLVHALAIGSETRAPVALVLIAVLAFVSVRWTMARFAARRRTLPDG